MHRPEAQPVKEFLKEPRNAVVCGNCKQECGTVVYFCRTTANHGFAHVVDNSEIFCWRWLWAAVIAAFTGVAIMLIHSSVTHLVSYSLTTEFIERSHGDTAILPDIHICDTSIFNMTRLADMGFDNTMATYLTLATSDNTDNPRFSTDYKKQAALKTKFDTILAKGPWTLKSVIENAAIKCDDMVLSCSHAGEYYDKRNCCNTFFDPVPHVSVFGSCITTHGKSIKQKYQSRDAGFVVYVLPNTLHIINFDTDLIKPEYVVRNGLYYAISSSTVHAGGVLHSTGRLAAPSSWVSLPITKSVVDNSELKNNLLAPYTCTDTNDSINFQSLTPGYDYYSKMNCHLAYWQGHYQTQSNCSAVFLKYGSSRADYSLLYKLYMGAKTYENAHCVCALSDPKECPIACVEEIYDVSPSYSDFNFELLDRQYDTNVSRYDPVALHFFYQSFQYLARISHTNTYLKWLGEVGGNLGLFLGASLISILEILALFFRCCTKCFST